ncbi:DHA2 family efflux MFS transporter permease subunit [Kibdelosporangium phytohabitans]|uniref:Multidrug transporter n=1 Tax=Kibdelosporangium phytohabitans TaxID=860235 RepID=A0A0N9IFK9_9PSEU|nr:DHA2 family efflux MFS transporter permease subunit [Kibdelosporangium phytohabitans]ALG13648.1 multidrug transporter [Kibdelosporangium phytohabitans]MBE1465533.1 EmrB/QacA subfamily drug resistance transporter [Kibdelosporangium phytohabitans]
MEKSWAALFALCFGFFMILVDSTIVQVAVPSLMTGLPATLNEVFWVNSVYLLTFAVPLLLAGRLGDRFGPRRLYLAGLVVFTAASLWCGLADGADGLIAARAVQGLGAAAMTPQSMAFISYLFPANRGAAMGVWGSVAGLATVTGPALGGLLTQSFGWEWIFFVNVPVGIVAITLVLMLVPDWQPRHSHRFDIPGIVLSSLGLFALVFGIQNGGLFDHTTVAAILATGVVLVVAFLWWQHRNPHEPLLPLRLFTSRAFSFGSLTGVLIGFAMAAMFIPLILYLQTTLGMTPLQAGLFMGPMSVVSAVLAPFAGRLSDRVDGKYIIISGLIAYAAGIGSVALIAQPGLNAWALVPGLLLCGVGIGTIFSPLSSTTIAGLEPRLIGAGAGIYNMARQVGNVLGSAAAGLLMQVASTDLVEAARITMLLPALVLLGAAFTAARMRGERVPAH